MRIFGPQNPRFGAVSFSCVVSLHSAGLTRWWVCFWEGSQGSGGWRGSSAEWEPLPSGHRIQVLCVGSKLTSRDGVAQGQLGSWGGLAGLPCRALATGGGINWERFERSRETRWETQRHSETDLERPRLGQEWRSAPLGLPPPPCFPIPGFPVP